MHSQPRVKHLERLGSAKFVQPNSSRRVNAQMNRVRSAGAREIFPAASITSLRLRSVDSVSACLASKVVQFPHSPKMDLAQELVDYIIDLIHDDPATLLRVSLVSKAWVCRTRAYLCKSLKITHSKLSSSDLSHLAPLGRYAKTLQLEWPGDTADPSAILDCFEQSEPHFLAIHSCELRGLDKRTIRRYFAKFPCTSITALELRGISATLGTLPILLSLFPNVDDLTISVAEWSNKPGSVGNENETIQQIPPPAPQGEFQVS